MVNKEKTQYSLCDGEYSLILRLAEKFSKEKIRAILNEGRKLTGEPLLPKNYRFRTQIRPITGRELEHPLSVFLSDNWTPSRTIPLSVDFIRLYGPDYLIGYLDGFEDKAYGYSVTECSESYVRAYVDGIKAAGKHRTKLLHTNSKG
jgi:hypothetical protein